MSSSKEIVEQSHGLNGNTELLNDHYRDWAPSYNEDLVDYDWVGPENVGALFTAMAGSHPWMTGTDVRVLDAGCGTGLAGVVLARQGVRHIDGFDLSEAMAAEARKTGVYTAVAGGVDINRGWADSPDGRYDVTVSCGVFTLGHVPPEGLRELVRLTRPGGLVLMTAPANYLAETDFEAYVDGLAREGVLKPAECRRNLPYTTVSRADYWAFELPQ